MFTTSVMWIHQFAHACTQAGSFLRKHAQCVNLAQQEGFPHEVSFQRWREVMLQREMGTRHKPAGGKWRLIKSPGFPGVFWAEQEISTSPPIWALALISSDDGRGARFTTGLQANMYTELFPSLALSQELAPFIHNFVYTLITERVAANTHHTQQTHQGRGLDTHSLAVKDTCKTKFDACAAHAS